VSSGVGDHRPEPPDTPEGRGDPARREIRLVIRGRVQGVGFRWFVRERARRWGLTGWVRNNPDGSVELAARGDDIGIAGIRRDVAAGPRGALVDQVAELPADGTAGDEPFTIRRG
jgi:acylphosphatase